MEPEGLMLAMMFRVAFWGGNRPRNSKTFQNSIATLKNSFRTHSHPAKNNYFKIQKFHFDHLKKHYAFNRLKFNPNSRTKRMQSMVTDYLMPKKNTQKILQPIFRELIEKAQNILNSKIIINKIMIERNKPENLNRLKEILQNSKAIKSQTKNVYLNAYGFHKDKLPKAFKKIMVYPFPAGMKNGTTILKGYDKKTTNEISSKLNLYYFLFRE